MTRFKSTWVSQSLRALERRGLVERYLRHVPHEHQASLLYAVPGTWLPTELVGFHYRACEALALPLEVQTAMGRDVIARVHIGATFWATRLAREGGATPWVTFAQFARLWPRVLDGGAPAVFALGPKEARVEFAGFPFAGLAYNRHGMSGVLSGLTSVFARQARSHVLHDECTNTVLAYRVQWV